MSNSPQGLLRAFREQGHERAVLFLHGFSGDRDDTWDQFPALLGTSIADCDIFTLGYATSFQPDLVGIWAADPDLPIVAKMFGRQTEIGALSRYTELTIIAHSMGGLVAQRAILDHESLQRRVNSLLLFGTPSGGLKKASWVQFWKRQFRNMARDGEFITALRTDWTNRFGEHPPFETRIVAGDRDQFVPPESSLGPFHRDLQYVVPGDHVSIVKPESNTHPSLQIAIALLSPETADAPKSRDSLLLAAEVPTDEAPQLVISHLNRDFSSSTNTQIIVNSALALERSGDRDGAIEILNAHRETGTDVEATLAGRYKRLWLESENMQFAQQSLRMYSDVFETAKRNNDAEQAYYHAINIAFLRMIAMDDLDGAREAARAAKAFALLADDQDAYWNIATQAEAELYLGDPAKALALYRKARAADVEEWKFASTALQAGHIAMKLGDAQLADELDELFSPAASQIRLIFVSYAHEDAGWVTELEKYLKPYMRMDESLQLWVDRNDIPTGARWAEKIEEGLSKASIGVALVTADYLNSDYVYDVELPRLVESAQNDELSLFWLYVSPAGYKTTALKDYKAANDPERPLAGMEPVEWQSVLNRVAEEIAMARLSA
ncbi:MAG: TIR domain-containing protein [Pseudomonadota bacterium]